MSKRKHNIAYIKPDEPAFLKAIKQQIGYKEGPTIDTKKEYREEATDSDFEDKDEEQPVVVVLKDGDLTAEEADAFQKKKDEEEASKPADLTKRVIFNKTKTKSKHDEELEKLSEEGSERPKSPSKKKSKKSKPKKVVLSFNEEEEDD